MDDRLYNLFVSNAYNPKDIYYSWWQLLQQQKDTGTMRILQLFTDMTGFDYSVEAADLQLLSEDANHLLEEKIIKAPFERVNILEDRIFLVNFDKFLEFAIAHEWKELMRENDWFNKSVMFVMALANSDCDECVMMGSLIATHILPNLCMVRVRLEDDIARVSCWRDSQRKSSLQKKQNYIDQICQVLIPDIKHGLKYLTVANHIMDKIFETIIAFPELMIITYGQLELISAGLHWKNAKVVHTALKCLKVLIVDLCSPTTKETVALFILKMETKLTRVMEKFKATDMKILNLFLAALGVVGNILLRAETAERIVLKMFSANENVVNAAIDLHGIYCTSIKPPDEVEISALIAILDVFERYDYPLGSFNTVIEKLWVKGFFRKFDGLFEMLSETKTRPNATFITNCTAQVINYCHQLLMDDIRTKISPSYYPHDTVDWHVIRKRIYSFMKGYPNCLKEASSSPNAYILLLNCLNPENNELYRLLEVDCEGYHVEVLFDVLSNIALNETSYSVLFHTLTTINSFDTIAHITEDVWTQLTEKYYTFFFHTRSRLRSYNLGIDMKLMGTYATAITRLCVLIEINNTSEDAFTLAEYLANDLRLLGKMKLTNDSEGIFYRLYKNALYAVAKCCLEQPYKKHPGIKFEQFGKRVQAFMAKLVEQLNFCDCSFTVANHVANALCNMLILTQESYASLLPVPLKQITYRIEPEVLHKLAKYIERHVFVMKTAAEEDTNCLLARKLMLATYNNVYELHHALPQQKDTYCILKYYEENKPFAEELEQLLNVLFGNDRNEFYTIVAQVVTECCAKSKFNAKVKKFIFSLHHFQAKHLPVEDKGDFSLNIIQCIIDKILMETDAGNGIQRSETKLLKLFDVLKPWVIKLPSNCSNELYQFIRQHENFSNLTEAHSVVRTHLLKFLKTVKK
ncbi:uncharacterized protein LOC128714805 [Anopheles marshallii]|uniref:uncharacterized protein LOC128714805 n=1 Tax=Anopheles marshallii TaxID=1521116 RepID=UPI00237B0240|nr:uncharacterized protein LOC128714805 [Anopheles marshallii]